MAKLLEGASAEALATAVPVGPVSREQKAIEGAFRNADGAGVALTKILNQLMLAAPTVLARLTATGDDAITPREFIQFTTSIAKATESLAKANQHSVSTSRAAAGVPNVQQVQHLHAHAHSVVPGAEKTERTPKEKRERMEWLISIHQRLSKPVEFDGAEDFEHDDDSEEGEAVG